MVAYEIMFWSGINVIERVKQQPLFMEEGEAEMGALCNELMRAPKRVEIGGDTSETYVIAGYPSSTRLRAAQGSNQSRQVS